MSRVIVMALACAAAVSLASCGGNGGSEPVPTDPGTNPGDGGNPPPDPAPGPDIGPPTHPVKSSRDGKAYRVALPVEATRDTMVFQVFEPTRLEVGKSYPLVLHGHGYGGTRTTVADEFIKKLNDAGYYVISFDQRGFGESSGTVRSMSPDFDGQNLIAMLDWAEELEGLRRRTDGSMLVGSYGGSYGGMYQFLLAGADPRQRLRVLAPDMTPHDLTYALFPNRVIKSGYSMALVGIGEVGGIRGELSAPSAQTISRLGPNQDAAIFETLMEGVLTNVPSQSGINFFKYHSVAYFCEGQPAGEQVFRFGKPDPLKVEPRPFAKIDALITQGFRDTLFNFNDGYLNYQCLKARGGDVRLLTHQSGHILPVSLTAAPGNLETALDPFYRALTVPNFQDAGGSQKCGSIDLMEATFAWFEKKLQGRPGLDAALPSGKAVCLSLGEGDAIGVDAVREGGTAFEIKGSTPQFNSALGVAGAVLGNGAREAVLAVQPLYKVPAGGAVLAGLPTMSFELAGLTGREQESCSVPLSIGACDPILLLGIGHRKAGTQRWDLIDDQLTPVRGFGTHAGPMSGIAERLQEGDELALLIYGFHAQYPITWSRDLLLPALLFNGTVRLPLLDGAAAAPKL